MYAVSSFLFSSKYFLIFLLISHLTHWLFITVLISVLVSIPNFFLLLFSKLSFCGQRTCFVLFYPFKLIDVLWSSVWSMLGYVSCVFEKNVSSATGGYSVLLVCVRSGWFIKAFYFLLVFLLIIASIIENEVF